MKVHLKAKAHLKLTLPGLLPLYGDIVSFIYKRAVNKKEKFTCPVCDYHGPFFDLDAGLRKNAQCPKCGSLERHRLQYLIIKELSKSCDFSKISMLHFAPEAFFRKRFRKMVRDYATADLTMFLVDHKVDLRDLPFEDAKYDFVFASHVLEHIKEDYQAIFEIRRVLKPAGIAVLPVPVDVDETIEYPEANPDEGGHVRAPGPDYFNRYRKFFARVDIYQSGDFSSKFQTFIYYAGDKRPDFVPVCYV